MALHRTMVCGSMLLLLVAAATPAVWARSKWPLQSVDTPKLSQLDPSGGWKQPIDGQVSAENQDHPLRHRRGSVEHGRRWKRVDNGQPSAASNHRDQHDPVAQSAHHGHGIHVAGWRWDEIGIYITFTLFIVVAGLAKVAFHHAHAISSRIPESCLLILLGTAVGGILYSAGVGICEGSKSLPSCSAHHGDDSDTGDADDTFSFPTFTPRLFFLILLPPIILESSYSLYDRAFADNIGTVLFYAVIGTLFNTFVIGSSLLGLVAVGWIGSVPLAVNGTAEAGTWPLSNATLSNATLEVTESYQLEATDCLVFSSLISAVDPVAVLAIFQEVGINKDLYFLVFGESLLNDAVTVVLYTMMVAFATSDHVTGEQYALGLAAFFTVSLGGLFIGIICGLITALITRTTSEVRVVEPLAVFGMAYFSYLSAELFHFSGIISTIGCGLVQAHYAFANVSHKSFITVKYFTKMLSSTSDSIIFLFLGMVLVNDTHQWHTGFALWVLVLCFIVRFAGVFLLTAVANRFRLKPINVQEQFIMAYGGLRGAVSFSLVEMLKADDIKPRQMFVTTTLIVILFTVFVQGATIRPLVDLLHIQKDSKDTKHLTDQINETMIYHITAGIEEICGKHGNNYFREMIEYVDERYLRRIFTRKTEKNSLTRLFEKLALSEHYANMYAATGHTGITPNSSAAYMDPMETANAANEVEKSPLLTNSPPAPVSVANAVAIAVGEAPRRSMRKFPLIRQLSAPLFMLPRVVENPVLVSPLAEEDEGVQMRPKSSNVKRSRPNSTETSVSTHSLDPEAAAEAFRKTLRNSKADQYKRLYRKHNRNLIGDDEDCELEMALRRRLSTAHGRRGGSLMNSPMSSPDAASPQKRFDAFTSSQPNSFEGNLPGTVSAVKFNATRRLSDGRPAGQAAAVTEAADRLMKVRSRPESRPPPPFSSLGIIDEKENEHRAVLFIQDIEEDEAAGTSTTKETGV